MVIFECIALFAAIFFFMFIHYWRFNRDVIIPKWPIIGMLPAVLNNLRDIHDFATLVLKHHGGTLRFEGPWLTNTNFIITSDHMNVQHITSKNFNNYGKGHDFHEIFEIFGASFLNSDSHEWKQQRTLLQSIYTKKSFMVFLQQTIENKVKNCLLPFLNHASEAGARVDFLDIFERFTFDSSCTVLFGFDPHCLPNKFTDLSENAYEKALPIIEDAIFYRHFTPKCLWKLQRWISEGGRIMHIPSYKFIAFNAGPRSCLGKDISLIQMKMASAISCYTTKLSYTSGGRSSYYLEEFACSWNETWIAGESY